MNIDELARIISAEGHNLLSESVPVPKSTIFAVVGCPNPMPDDLVLKLRLLAKVGATVAFLRDEDLSEFPKDVKIIFVDSLPTPEPSDFERIHREFHLKEHELIVVGAEIFNDSHRNQNYFIPMNQIIPANCRRSNRYLCLNRRIMRR